MIRKKHTYDPSEDEFGIVLDDDWDYPSLDNDKAIERFIEKRRIEFRREWFRYLEENEVYE